MAKSVSKNPLAGKLNNALKSHAKDSTNYGVDFGNLPAGIVNGVAQLVDAKISEYKSGPNQGQKFLYLAGVVVEPKTFTDVRQAWMDGSVKVVSSQEVTVEGMRTSLTLPLCDTKNASGETTSTDENVERALNEVRKVGGEDCTEDVASEEDLAAVLESLKEAGPYFKFNTSGSTPTKDRPTMRVWENWRGAKGLDDYQPEQTDAVQDDSSSKGEDEEQEQEAEEQEASADDDLEALAEAADEDNDSEEAAKLTEMCEELGIDLDDHADKTWAEMVEIIREAQSGGGEPEEEETPSVPEKGEVYKYKPPKAKKPVECEVVAVFESKGTCNLKNLDDGKSLYKSIPFDQLICD